MLRKAKVYALESRGQERLGRAHSLSPRSSPHAARGKLNIMGLNTGTQSEQNGERRGGENNVVKQPPIPPFLVKRS
jgi:hypothetical protein